jgi:hypothetical protein
VNGKRLIKRIVIVLGGAALFLLLATLAQGSAQATPIRPDVKQLTEQPESAPPKYEPARAGWNGPETSPAVLARMEARAAQTRAVRQALAVVLTPDPRALAALLMAIVVLRKLRQRREAQVAVAMPSAPDWQMPRAA